MPSTSQMLVISGAVFALSLLVSVLPFMGAGNYSYSGEGFCYIDWYGARPCLTLRVMSEPQKAMLERCCCLKRHGMQTNATAKSSSR